MSVSLNRERLFDSCDTLMLDMDGTLLDLAFDNFMWKEFIPAEYARHHELPAELAQQHLYAQYRRLLGKLDWYCLDHWSEALGIDVLALHRRMHQRIGWLPGAREFLEAVSTTDIRLLLVSNSHPDTLAVKSEVTGIVDYFDQVYLSHHLGHAKEEQPFWQVLRSRETFDPARTCFIDDTETVLSSAQRFGIQHVIAVTRPDTTGPLRTISEFASIEGVCDLMHRP
ncbi:MAG TPA: HAD-IA family hydrolase [Woeseiaceae bacterium]|nr:HAD-IA family hydrolase [Woeseiaceae bacterium]